MKREERFPIEPLPEATWQRIEREVLAQTNAIAKQRAPKSPRVVRAVAVVAALQVAAAVLFFLWSRRDVELPAALASTRLVTEADTVETTLGDISIRAEPASALLLVAGGLSSSLVVLERGSALFSVPTRGERAPFAVQAGEVRVEVVGTRFRVERRAGVVRVDTYEGKVRVVSRGESTFVSRDESWSEKGPAAIQDEPAPQATSPQAKEPARAPSAREPAAATAAASAESERSYRRALRFDQAARLEATDPQQALRLYQALVSEGGRWGEPALYAMARLSLELGDEANAQRLLKQYLERHPRGANVSDVRALVGQLAAEGAAP